METDLNSKSFRVVLCLCPPEHTESAEPQVSVRVSGLNSVTAETGRGHRAHVLDFDAVWSEGASLRDVYESTAKPLVEWVIRGYNGSLILYGPSSSVDPHSVQSSSCRLRGIISRAADQIFSSPECSLCRVRVSFYHISNEKIYDLLEPHVSEVCRIHDTEEAVLLEGLREVEVSSAEELLQVFRRGTAHRNAGVSKGDFASKSHMVFNIIVINMRGQFKEGLLTASKLTLVDLASSGKAVFRNSAVQDVRRSFHVAPENLQEAKTLKRSLTIFRNVIFSLSAAGCQHVPYRESKLTRALRDCLGGNCRTCLLVSVATLSSSVTETMSCLQFAARAMSVPSRSIHSSQMCYTTAQVQNVWATEKSAHLLTRAQMLPPVSADRRSQASLPPILATSGPLAKPKPRSSLDSSESHSFLPQLEKPSPMEPNGRYSRGSQSMGEKSRAVDSNRVCVLKGAVPLSHSGIVLSSSSSSLASSLALGAVTECSNCKQERKIREEYDKFIIQVKRDRDSLSQRVTELEKELRKRGGEERESRREGRESIREGTESREEDWKPFLKNSSRPCSGCHDNMDSHTSHTHMERHSSHTHTVTTNTEMLLMSHCVSQQCTTDLPHGSKCCFSLCSSFPESSECGFTERSSEPTSHSCHCDPAQHKPSLYKQLRREHSLLLDVMLVLYKREWFLQDAMPYVRRTLRKCGLSLEHTD
ncbi:kinesin heavy chain [Colossoma macropomum]|uniref:kinesin heavy chain n=1 Tax=Colossoma macropomum TaxID=42526 RepID=UPI001864B44D|nr:kinesin heavy chain [Colossoma macropomum]